MSGGRRSIRQTERMVSQMTLSSCPVVGCQCRKEFPPCHEEVYKYISSPDYRLRINSSVRRGDALVALRSALQLSECTSRKDVIAEHPEVL